MDQTSSLCKAHNPKMFLGDLAERTSFATLQMGWLVAQELRLRPVFRGRHRDTADVRQPLTRADNFGWSFIDQDRGKGIRTPD